jgi:hypothetical protein
MIRKLILALGATAAIGAAALAPTAASAHPHGHWGHWYGHGHGIGIGFYAPTYVAAPDCYIVKRVVETPYGPRERRVTVCD